MLSVRRGLGRTVVIQAEMPVASKEVLSFHQSLTQILRRLGEPALILTDLRALQGIDPDAGRMLVAMLGSPGLVARHALLVAPGSAGEAIATQLVAQRSGGSWRVCTDPTEVVACLRGHATPPELHEARAMHQRSKAA